VDREFDDPQSGQDGEEQREDGRHRHGEIFARVGSTFHSPILKARSVGFDNPWMAASVMVSPMIRQRSADGMGFGTFVAIAALILLASLGVGSESRAEDGAGEAATAEGGSSRAPQPVPTSEEARAKLAEIEAQIAKLESDAKAWAARARADELVRSAAPDRLVALQAELESTDVSVAEAELAGETSLEELESLLLDAEQDLALARREEASLQTEAARRPERRKKLPELMATAKARRQALAAAPPSVDDEPALFEAGQRLARARMDAVEREIEAYQAEYASFDLRGQLLRKNLDVSARQMADAALRVETYHAAVRERQEIEAREDAERARQTALDAMTLPEAVQALASSLAQENEALAGRRTGEAGLPVKIDDLRQKLARADEHIAELDTSFDRLAEKVEAAGLSDSVGLMLRKQRTEVPDIGKYRRFIRMRQERIAAVQLEQIDWRDQRRELARVDAVIEEAMSLLDASATPADRERIETILRDLLVTRRDYVDALIDDYETYFQNLVDFDARQQELIDKSEALLQYIDERVLWIPSSEAVRATAPSDTWEGLGWLLSPKYTGQLAKALARIFSQSPVLTILVLLSTAVFLGMRPRVHRRLATLAEEAHQPTCIRGGCTWEALGLSLLLTPWLAGLLAYAGWQLTQSPVATQYVRCVAYGALSAALVWISLEVPRQLLRANGLFEAHFGAPSEATQRLRRLLGLLMAIVVPAVFVIQALEMRNEDAWRESVGRLAFLVAMLSTLIVMHGTLRESAGSFWAIVQQPFQPVVRRTVRILTHGSILAIGTFLIAAALRGYYWTSLKLASSFLFTLVFLFLLLALYRLFVRWSLLARRRLAFEQLKIDQEAASSQAGGSEAGEIDTRVDLQAVDLQTGRLVKSATAVAFVLGLWVIWADLLPAVGILRDVTLWNSTGSVTVEMTNAAGETRSSLEDRVIPVTLADLLLAVILGALTLVTVRNLPGFLEITIFRRLAPGERYAYGTIAKYGVTLVGIAIAFNAIGIGWSNIQWLVAAVGLGLGFGLQEIFANFVSGLIILFERPIRVGDTVTVGNISGVVSRIRIRATWITGFDRKELVVPNKEFVTTQLVNWSLSDAVSRLDIKVGVAYGSDTERTLALLRSVAEANPQVLRDPPPSVFFLAFGESTLDFELRVFSPSVEQRLPIVHALHMEIDKAFREAKIEIAFPQRDLHIRTTPREAP
jgi:potassium efflux system protein